jgi:hypothetical protein
MPGAPEVTTRDVAAAIRQVPPSRDRDQPISAPVSRHSHVPRSRAEVASARCRDVAAQPRSGRGCHHRPTSERPGVATWARGRELPTGRDSAGEG